VQIVLNLVTARVKIKDKIWDRNLTPRLHGVEEFPLPAYVNQLPRFGRASDQEPDAAS